jgi:hypothetical protein
MPPAKTACFDRSVVHVHRALGYGAPYPLRRRDLDASGLDAEVRERRRRELDAEVREPRRRMLMLLPSYSTFTRPHGRGSPPAYGSARQPSQAPFGKQDGSSTGRRSKGLAILTEVALPSIDSASSIGFGLLLRGLKDFVDQITRVQHRRCDGEISITAHPEIP